MTEVIPSLIDLLKERDELKEDYQRTCLLVAQMHRAAMNDVIGPKIGVVEDILDLREERDNLAAQNEGMREAIELYFNQYPHMMKGYILDAINSPNLAEEVLKRRDAEIDLAADRLEVLEREHAEFFDRRHGERRMREKLVDDVERCYRMLLSEPNTKGALFKAENILREALADAKASAFIPVRLSDVLCNG